MNRKKSNGRRGFAQVTAPLKTAAETAKAQARAKAAKIAGDIEESIGELAERIGPYPTQDG
jgi:hypothetical protein